MKLIPTYNNQEKEIYKPEIELKHQIKEYLI